MSIPAKPADPVRIALHVAVYVVLYFATAFVFGPLLMWLGGEAGYLPAIALTGFASALFANWLALRIYEARTLPDLGLAWNPASRWNLALGMAGGVASAVLVLGPPLAIGAARFAPMAGEHPSWGAPLYLAVLLWFAAAGEEMFIRGYGFQLLLRHAGPWATILPVGIIFAALHSGNPSASWLGLVNTAGFGVLFGFAFLRSRDLWLPIGLHFGWNVTLPLFGTNVSGLKMGVTGHQMAWTAGRVWSGGDYGPEGSILTSVVLALLWVYVVRVPVRRQPSPLTDPPADDSICEPQPSLPS
jgi:membrane protease YdiL (CAAX protease family)